MAGDPVDAEGESADRVPDETRVLRRIPPGRFKTLPDASIIPDSDNFSVIPGETGTSVDFWEGEAAIESTLSGHAGFGLVSLTVADIRALGLDVVRAPRPDNPRHGLIVDRSPERRSRKVKRRLAEACRWVREPSTDRGP